MNTKQPDLNKISEIIAAANAADKAKGIIVIPELRDLLPKLSEPSFNELKSAIVSDGITDPILIWKEQNAVVDGHNRFQIATELELPFKTVERSFPDIHAVKRWMVQNQLGRRNLTKHEFDYFIGTLYNETKSETKDSQGGVSTAKVIGDAHGISEKSVRRNADFAKGVDKIAQVKGVDAKTELLTGKPSLTKDEVKEIGKASNATVAGAAIKQIEQLKKNIASTKKAQTTVTKSLAAAPTQYRVAFVKPDFANQYNEATEPRPPLEKEAIIYLYSPDEHLGDAMSLLKRWGLQYEASIVYNGNENHGGVFTKITHSFLLIATKGTIGGPKKVNILNSVQTLPKDVDPTDSIFKLIAAYSPDGNRIDMRIKAKGKSPTGWDSPK